MTNDDRRSEKSSFVIPLKGLEPWVSRRTVRVAEQLLDLSKRGDCVGIAFAAVLRNGRYARGYTGVTVRQPEIAIGILQRVISDLLSQADANSRVPP